MKFYNRFRTRSVVKAVDILSHNGDLSSLWLEAGFKLCNGLVAEVGNLGSHHLAPVVIEFPHQRWVSFEGFRRGELLSSIRAPQTSCASVRIISIPI